jgi:multiple sugar transport system ATP-binding protein
LAVVELRNLEKWYGAFHAIRSIDLRIEDGSFVALVGPSGCGKSTTLRMIAGLEVPTEGGILIGDRDVTDVPSRDRGVAMVFQSYALYPHMTVEENMTFGLRIAGTPAPEIRSRLAHAAGMLKIDGLLGRRPAQLSGGQRQRVAIGRALVRQPEVFLFDEPLSNLDAQLRTAMRMEIKRLHQSLKATIVFVTHDQVEAMTMADVIVVMRDGRVEQVGSPLDLFERPANLFVGGFIGAPAMRFLDGVVRDDVVALDGGAELPLGAAFGGLGDGRPVRVGIRPEDVVPDGHGMPPGRAWEFTAAVTLSEPLGNETLLLTDLGGQELLSRMYRPRSVRAGEIFRFAIDLDRIHVFDRESGASLRR